MAIIQVTPELLESKAGEVRNLKSLHDELMAKMKTLVHSLNEQWKGEAQDAFVAKFDSMQPTFTNFSEMLESYAKIMDTSAKTLREADQALKSSINSAGQ